MAKFANLEQQIYAASRAERGTEADVDFWAGRKFRGRKVRALPEARLVAKGLITDHQWLTLKNVMNQGFNGQVASVQAPDGRYLQIPLNALRPFAVL